MEKHFKVEAVAELIGVKKSTIYKWSSEDYIPHVKVGGCLRFKATQIEKWLDAKSKAGRKKRRIEVL